MTSIFEPVPNDFSRLDDVESAKLFRKLLLVEAEKNGIPKTKIHITTSTNIPDGGIDAKVDWSKAQSEGLLIKGKTGYQLKTGNTFKPWTERSIKKELFGNKSASKSNLKSGIKQCVKEGRYVIVTFGHQIDDKNHRKAIKILKSFLKKCGHSNPNVDVLGQNHLANYLKSYPALVLELKQVEYPTFHNHRSWSEERDMSRTLVKTVDYDAKVKEIQKILESTDTAKHIRIIAEAGIGKTRFALEATRNEKFASLVIYTRATDPRLHDLVGYLLGHNDTNAILVVDDCNRNQQNDLWNVLSPKGRRVKLITIYNEMTELKDGSDITYPNPPKLTDSEIEKILTSSPYNIPNDQATKWATFAGGYPRFAHLLGINLKMYPDDISRSVDSVYDKLFAKSDSSDDEKVKKRRKVIRFLSLFKRFGFRDKFEVEAKLIHALIIQICPELTWQQFKEIIEWFENEKIIQGSNTLYISVPVLQIAMWKEWWDKYSKDVDLGKIFEKIPASSQLRGWFYDMCKYTAESQKAAEIVKFLLGSNGPFKKLNLIEDIGGSRFFLALADSMPKEALECLEITIGRWPRKKLLNFRTGRRESIYVLEKAAVHENLFSRSAKLLLNLAEAENETWANNASGVFTGLFSLGHGKVAPTATPPSKRLEVLEFAFRSKSKIKRNLAIKACSVGLETRYFSRIAGAEEQGLKEIPLWKPKSRKEVIQAYDDILNLLVKNLRILSKDEKDGIVQSILSSSRGLIIVPELTDRIISILKLIHNISGYEEQLLESIIHILDFENKNLKNNVKIELEKLQSRITGKDYHSLMKRYVSMDSRIDLFRKGAKYDEVRQKEIKNLVTLSMHKNNLKKELHWLVTEEAKNGYQFGYELGNADKKIQFLSLITNSQKKAKNKPSTVFLGGYFRALFDRDVKLWEKEIANLAKDSQLKKSVIEVSLRSGLSDSVGLLLLKMAKEEEFQPQLLQNFRYGSVIRKLSEKIFLEWVDFLLKLPDQRIIFTILDLFDTYFVHRQDKQVPSDITFSILTDERILKKKPEVLFGTMDEFYWTDIAKTFVKQTPSRAFDLADKILANFDSSFFDRFDSQAQEVIDKISDLDPIKMWQIVSNYISIPMDLKTRNIRDWLRSPNGFLLKVPFLEINNWIKKDVKNRAWFIAYSIPSIFGNNDNNLVKQLLIHYGNRLDVKRNLIANFDTESYSGPGSVHFASKKQIMEKFRESTTHPKILKWIDWYLSILDSDINRERNSEEREFY